MHIRIEPAYGLQCVHVLTNSLDIGMILLNTHAHVVQYTYVYRMFMHQALNKEEEE